MQKFPRHCEEVTGVTDVAIQPLAYDKSKTQIGIFQQISHPNHSQKCDSGSVQTPAKLSPLSSAVRNDGQDFSKVPRRKSAFTLAEGTTHVDIFAKKRQVAFTLAEVLITLGVIGIVAAMTLPTLTKNYQKKVLKEQFKVAYSLLLQTWTKIEADWGYTPECYYWSQSPYKKVCVETDSSGHCIKYTLEDGSPLPSDISGRMGDCRRLIESLPQNLQVVTVCKNDAYEKGCIPDYAGYDTLIQNENPDMSEDEVASNAISCSGFNKKAISKNRNVYVLKNGMILIPYVNDINWALFAVDINGKKGPNKWGHDLFSFTVYGSIGKPLKLEGGTCMLVEKDGLTTKQMLEEMNKK